MKKVLLLTFLVVGCTDEVKVRETFMTGCSMHEFKVKECEFLYQMKQDSINSTNNAIATSVGVSLAIHSGK